MENPNYGGTGVCQECQHSVNFHFKIGEPHPENKNCKVEGCSCPIDYSKGGLSKLDAMTSELKDISKKF